MPFRISPVTVRAFGASAGRAARAERLGHRAATFPETARFVVREACGGGYEDDSSWGRGGGPDRLETVRDDSKVSQWFGGGAPM